MDIKEILIERQRKNEILKTLIIDNITIDKAVDGYAELSLYINENMLNVHDKIHGGVLFTLADYAAGACSVSLGKKVVTLNASINFIKANPCGKVISKAKAVHFGKSTIVVNVEIFDFNSLYLLCNCSFTMFVIGEYF